MSLTIKISGADIGMNPDLTSTAFEGVMAIFCDRLITLAFHFFEISMTKI